MNDIGVFINGRSFCEWNKLRLTKSIESMAGDFCFNYVKNSDIWAIHAGDKVEIRLENLAILSGWIDSLSPDLSKDDRQIEVVGRDRTGDLVDCNHLGARTEFTRRQSLLEIATELARPFGISVSCELAKPPSIETFKIDPGERIFEALDRAASQLGLVFQPRGDGNLVLESIGSKQALATVSEGFEILDCYASFDHSERFSDYVIKSMDKDHRPFTKKSKDENISRYRAFEIVADTLMTEGEAQTRVNWEAAVRAARACEVSVTVQGWTHDAMPWTPNMVCRVDAPSIGICDQNLLIKSVSYFFDDSGTSTELTMTNLGAYTPDPIIKRGDRSGVDPQTYGYM